MIHRRTMWALGLALGGGFLAGGLDPAPVSLAAGGVVALVSLALTPNAETVARDWLDVELDDCRDDSDVPPPGSVARDRWLEERGRL